MTAYDPETNLPADLNNLESKWYRLEREFVAIDTDVKGNNGGLAILTPANTPAYLVDEVTMYHKIGDEWIAMSDGTAVSNGDFENGVDMAFGLDPIDVKVENKTESVVLSWTNPQDQKTNIYNGDDLLMTAEAGISSVTITDLTGDVEYTFTLKGVGSQRESEGVSVTGFPYQRLSDTDDIILGIEVFKYWPTDQEKDAYYGAPHWLTTYQDKPSTLYLTHEAYEGNAALLIVPPGNANSYPANHELSKALDGNDDADKVISGDTYKIVWYAKPVAQNSNGVYMISTGHRYYNDYKVFEQDIKFYDAQTGIEVTNGVYENKWYRCESEFVASAGNAETWVGFALRVDSNTSAQLIDNVQMYHMVNDEWHLMKDVTGVRNGNFEEGVVGDDTAPYEVENFGAVAGDAQVQLSWDKVEVDDLAGYTIWNGSDKIADLDRTATSYTATGLDNDTEYTFIIRAYDRFGNSSEGTPVSVTPTTPEYEIGEFNMGQTIVSGTNIVSVSVKNNKKADGLNAQLILGLYDKASNTLVKAAASEVVTTAVGESNTLTAALSVEDLNAADYELKAFLWESLDSVSPLTAGASIGE